MSCNKIRFPDKLAAKIALARIQGQDKEGHTEKRVYFCHVCRGYHLTSKPRLPRKRK